MILFERYYAGYSESTPSLSFSMAKSFLSLLIGIAIDEGYIESIHARVTDFVPELAVNGYDQVTVKHLLQMTSGMRYLENDNPFGIHPRFYYTQRLEYEILRLKLKEQPGLRFQYKTGENALLALILTRALGEMTITEYTQERIWTPLGMEYDGAWSIDHAGNGLEKSGCCLTATARDFAKIGRLYLHNGSWNGKQIVPSSWVEQSTAVDTSEGSVWNYQYQWWLASEGDGDFYASGHLGQYLYVNPHEQLIIVRLGTSKGNLDSEEWVELFRCIAKEVGGI
jgi:CubicO group peptidase (beta-lactamase class C family)